MSDYPNSGILGKNERQRPNSNDAGYSGQCKVDGKEYWINAWVKDGKKGKFFSLSFKPKDATKQGAPTNQPKQETGEVPF